MRRSTIVIGFVLAVLMFLSFGLAGCQQEKTAEQTTEAQNTGAQETQEAIQETEAPEPQLEPVTLSWYCIFPQQPDQDMVLEAFNELAKEKINAEVELMALDWSNYDEKLQIMAATNEEFDIVWLSDWMGTQYADWAYKEVIIPLDDLLPEYAPQAFELIEAKFWDAMRVNGEIYGVPCYQEFYRQPGMWFKKDLVEKYAFDYENAATYKDVEAFLDAVKKGEPEITPLGANQSYMFWFEDEMNPGGVDARGRYKDLGHGFRAFESDPMVIVNEITDADVRGYTEANVQAARQWYENGYVRPDFLVIDDLDTEIEAGNYACGFTMIAPDTDVSFADRYGFEIVHITTGLPQLSGVQATELCVGATSKNPERALMLIELLITDKEIYNLIANGIEGQHYTLTGENRMERAENNQYQPDMNWELGNKTLSYLLPGQPDNLWEIIAEGNANAIEPFMGDWNFNPENVRNEDAAMEALWQSMGDPLWSGTTDPAGLQEYFDAQNDAGKDAIEAEMKKQLDEYWQKH